MSQERITIELVDPEDFDPHAPCSHARDFTHWTNALVQAFNQNPTIPTLYLAQKQLLDHYMAIRETLPPNHRYHVGNRGHTCVWYVFKDCYDMFRAYETRVMLNPLAMPQPKAERKGSFIESLLGDDGGEAE